jgi:hypothetical protein
MCVQANRNYAKKNYREKEKKKKKKAKQTKNEKNSNNPSLSYADSSVVYLSLILSSFLSISS